MSSSEGITDAEFQLLRGYIEQQCGIALGDEKAYLVETRLTKLMAMSGCENFHEFYKLANSGTNVALKDKIIDAMTTNETLWFRDMHPFVVLREKMLPGFVEDLKSGKRNKVRIWSAAASTGQEAYSIAITIAEFCKTTPGISPDQFEIIGSDISASALFLANAGRYHTLAMSRGLDETIRDRYFKKDGSVWEIDETIRKMATFKKFNLQDSPTLLGKFDIIFLRYVAIYFSDDFKRNLYLGLASALSETGYFVVGAVESLRGVSDDFKLNSHAGGYYYVLNKHERV